jgi:hypothetical protein
MALSTFIDTAASLTLATGHAVALRPGTGRILTDLRGWYSPPAVRRESTARLGSHGTFSERGWRDERLISITGHAFADTRAEAAALTDELAAMFADGTEGTFAVDDYDVGYRDARVYLHGTPEVVWDGQRDVTFALDLVAPDPRKYGRPVQLSTLAAAPGGGLITPLFSSQSAMGVLDFGPPGIPGTVTFRNPGTADTAPRFTITGHAPGFTITEVESGDRLDYVETVPAGSALTIDAADGSVVLDGLSDRSPYLTRREWSRIPGGASRTYLFESRNNSGARMTLEVNPAWW